jgi:aspartyl/asparaginyl-tRNA synthetase
MTFEEAKTLLKSKAQSIVHEHKGLSREQELTLVETLNGGNPIFVIDWPKIIKPFYMRECSYNESLVCIIQLSI